MKKEQHNSFVKEQITHALLSLMKHHPFEDITITEIVKNALVSRASFYRNFINKEDILKQHLVKLIQEWGTEFEQSKNPNFVESLFGHYLKYAETYQLLYKCGLSYLVLDTIKSVCGPKPEQENIQAYTNAWLACGLFGWIDEWIIRGMQESPIEMARLVEWSQQSNNSSPIN